MNFDRFQPNWSNVSSRRVAVGMLILSLGSGILGYINQYSGFYIPSTWIGEFYANISSELASIAITVLIIDFLNDRQQVKQKKEELILQLASPTNIHAKEAARILRQKSWLQDGTLREANLSRADLREAYLAGIDLQLANLSKVNLTGAYLQNANLRGAQISDVELCRARYLVGAIMPDGTVYDGRYNLPGDLRWMSETKKIARTDDEGMALWYGVSAEVYQEGQKWAAVHLEQVRTTPILARSEEDALGFVPYVTILSVAKLKVLLANETSLERIRKWHYDESNRQDRPKRKSVISLLERKIRALTK